MANQWNLAVQGLLQGLSSLGQGYLQGRGKKDAYAGYKQGLNALYDQKQELLDIAKNEVIGDNGIEVRQDPYANVQPKSNQGAYLQGMENLYKPQEKNQFMDILGKLYSHPYGDDYAKLLSGLYQKTIPDYEMKSFDKDKDVYLWDKNRNRYTKIQEGKNKKKERILTGEERYITEKDEQGNDVYYRVYPKEITNEDGSVTLEQVKDKVTEKEFKKFEDKQMTYPEKLEMKNSYNLQYKMDLKDLGLLGGNSKKKKGTGKETYDKLTSEVKKDVDQYLEDSYKHLNEYKQGGEWKVYLDSENARLREIVGEENMKAIVDDFWTEGLKDKDLAKRINDINLGLPNTEQIQQQVQQQIPQQYQQFVKIKLNGQTFDMRDATSRANLEKMILEQIMANPEIIAGLQAKLATLPPEIQEYIQSIIQGYQP